MFFYQYPVHDFWQIANVELFEWEIFCIMAVNVWGSALTNMDLVGLYPQTRLSFRFSIPFGFWIIGIRLHLNGISILSVVAYSNWHSKCQAFAESELYHSHFFFKSGEINKTARVIICLQKKNIRSFFPILLLCEWERLSMNDLECGRRRHEQFERIVFCDESGRFISQFAW